MVTAIPPAQSAAGNKILDPAVPTQPVLMPIPPHHGFREAEQLGGVLRVVAPQRAPIQRVLHATTALTREPPCGDSPRRCRCVTCDKAGHWNQRAALADWL